MSNLPPPQQMNFKANNLPEAWRRWEQSFENYFMAVSLSKKPKTTQVAILMHCAGPDAINIKNTFSFTGEGKDKEDNYKTVLKKFWTFCEGKKNTVFERYKFWERKQQPGESFDAWVTDLKNQATICEFGDQHDNMIRDKIVFGTTDQRVKERLLTKSDLTLQTAEDMCRAAEISKQQIKSMASTSQIPEVDIVDKKQSQKQNKSHCGACGFTHVRRQCPAKGKTCDKCKGQNHFASVCCNKPDQYRKSRYTKSKNVHPVEQSSNYDYEAANRYEPSDDTDDESLFCDVVSIGSINKQDKWQQVVLIENSPVKCKLDTGAQANILPLSTFRTIRNGTKLQRTNVILKAFGESKVKPMGTVELDVHLKGKETGKKMVFFVTDEAKAAIIGQDGCEDLGLIQRISIDTVKADIHKPLTLKHIEQSFSNNFEGYGLYEKEYDIKLDPSVPPVIQPARKIPYAKYDQLKATLEELEKKNIIAPTYKPTDWVSNLVITEKKNGQIRICLDPKPLNKAIKRERYNIPTPADVQRNLNGKKIYTILDMKDGYWHVKLSPNSRYMCTFNTPWGRKRFLRMPFGISSAAEVMQKRNEETFGDIGDVHMVADDMIIASETESAHDATLLKVMTRAQEKGVKFNKKKIQFKVAEVNYLGNIITPEGIKPDPKKISAIANMPTPHDRQSLLRLLGMVKYLSAYIPHESIITAPMRALLRKDVAWQWEHEHNTALEQVKAALASAPVLQFYCVKKAVRLQADASQSGLGACLLQEGKPIAYASRALTNAERNYAQIEKELLAIYFACTKFHQYIYGKECRVQTDHHPLEAIFRKPMNQTSPRLQRMLLKLQRYQLNVGYIPGKLMYVADTLSRAHPPQGKYQDDEDFDDELEIMVQSMLSNIPIKAMDWKKIQQATEDDPIFQGLKSMIINGWPDHKSSLPSELQPYWQVKDDLYIANEVVLYNERIVIPAELQTKALALLHESHQGTEKSKIRAKSTMFWPGIGQDVEDSVEKCPICLTHRNQQQKEPLLPHPVPERPWQKVGSDILTFQNVDYLLVVDYYSIYPEIIKIEDKSAGTIIAKMKAIFARHGIPEELMSDNIPYASKEFHQFASEWNIKLTTSSPLYPQS